MTTWDKVFLDLSKYQLFSIFQLIFQRLVLYHPLPMPHSIWAIMIKPIQTSLFFLVKNIIFWHFILLHHYYYLILPFLDLVFIHYIMDMIEIPTKSNRMITTIAINFSKFPIMSMIGTRIMIMIANLNKQRIHCH